MWALYLLFVIIQRTRFCNFDMRSHSKPQFVIPNSRCESISESYINYIAEMGKCRYSLLITLSVCEILFAIFLTCEFQFIYSFTVRPIKLNSVARLIRVLFIMRHGLSFSVRTSWRWWNIMNLVFWTLSDSLFTASQSAILFNSEIIKVLISSILPLHPSVNEHIGLLSVVSSAYKIKLRLSLTVYVVHIDYE